MGYKILDLKTPVWERVHTVAPLVVIGTREGENYDLAPKHMATPLGRSNYFGFVCTPEHSTWHNVVREKAFTVSFPKPDQVSLASLAASPRIDDDTLAKPIVAALPTSRAKEVDALVLRDSYLILECELVEILEGFDSFGLIAGKIVHASVDEDYLVFSGQDEQDVIHMHPLLAYVAHGRFAKIRETYSFPFPRGFEGKDDDS